MCSNQVECPKFADIIVNWFHIVKELITFQWKSTYFFVNILLNRPSCYSNSLTLCHFISVDYFTKMGILITVIIILVK